MSHFDHTKYRAFKPLKMDNRQWPDQIISQAPQWCSVDLRDGNQALIDPMNMEQKCRLFLQLVKIGFKEIEVGFPAASQTDFDFLRKLIDENMIPDDVSIQILTPARTELIQRSFEALQGVKKAVVHLYNSTSVVQREKVFVMDKAGITDIAVFGAKEIKRIAAEHPNSEWRFQYSPESFTGTEMEFAAEVCRAVLEVWQPTPANPVILNLPATVEMSTPNIYADQVEWFCHNIGQRDLVEISVHAHNDRGCAVAASELAVMAGADRVEGTLMGNGERTGNLDIVTMAMNLYSQGVNPELDFSNMEEIIACVKECTSLPIHPRHPYVGELVFTAFSGSHQDAIKKCLKLQQPQDAWDVAYLPINPEDLGRNYQEVIRINSQSGKGGVAYVLEQQLGVQLPRWLQIEFSQVVQKQAEAQGTEVQVEAICRLFADTYLSQSNYSLGAYRSSQSEGEHLLSAELQLKDQSIVINGQGSGVIDAFVQGLSAQCGHEILLIEYAEHALETEGSNKSEAEAMAYVQLNIDGQRACGIGRSADIAEASMKAILGALNTVEALAIAV